jgi:hypothetical protein
LEKYLAKIKIKTILVGSIGSKENIPILYHDLMPLISGAKKNTPIKARIHKKYKVRIIEGFSLIVLLSIKLTKNMQSKLSIKNPPCLYRLEKSPDEELNIETIPIITNRELTMIKVQSILLMWLKKDILAYHF